MTTEEQVVDIQAVKKPSLKKKKVLTAKKKTRFEEAAKTVASEPENAGGSPQNQQQQDGDEATNPPDANGVGEPQEAEVARNGDHEGKRKIDDSESGDEEFTVAANSDEEIEDAEATKGDAEPMDEEEGEKKKAKKKEKKEKKSKEEKVKEKKDKALSITKDGDKKKRRNKHAAVKEIAKLQKETDKRMIQKAPFSRLIGEIVSDVCQEQEIQGGKRLEKNVRTILQEVAEWYMSNLYYRGTALLEYRGVMTFGPHTMYALFKSDPELAHLYPEQLESLRKKCILEKDKHKEAHKKRLETMKRKAAEKAQASGK